MMLLATATPIQLPQQLDFAAEPPTLPRLRCLCQSTVNFPIMDTPEFPSPLTILRYFYLPAQMRTAIEKTKPKGNGE